MSDKTFDIKFTKAPTFSFKMEKATHICSLNKTNEKVFDAFLREAMRLYFFKYGKTAAQDKVNQLSTQFFEEMKNIELES